MEPRLFTTTEVSVLLQVTRQSVALWARSGKIPHGKTPGNSCYRFLLKDINEAREGQGLPSITEEEALLILAYTGT